MLSLQDNSIIMSSDKPIIIASDSVRRYSNENLPFVERIYKKLENEYGCTYLFYLHEDLKTNTKTVYTSHDPWQDELIGEKLLNSCAIFKALYNAIKVRKLASILIPWNTVDFNTSREKDVLLYREEFNIANGIGLTTETGNIREGIAFGGDRKDFNFYQRVINHKLIYRTLVAIRPHILGKLFSYTALLDYYAGNNTIH